MRGSPLLRALLAFGIILLLGLPLWHLTHAPVVKAASGESAPRASAEEPQDIGLALTFTTSPARLRVRHLGKEIWASESPAAQIEQTLKLPFPKEGVDLEFEAKFPDGAPLAAMRVRLTDPDGGEHEKTAWGQGEIDEVLTFP